MCDSLCVCLSVCLCVCASSLQWLNYRFWGQIGNESWLNRFLPAQTLRSHLTCLCLSLPVCEVGRNMSLLPVAVAKNKKCLVLYRLSVSVSSYYVSCPENHSIWGPKGLQRYSTTSIDIQEVRLDFTAQTHFLSSGADLLPQPSVLPHMFFL